MIMVQFQYNPFHDSGITNYEQFKLYPFLVFGTLNTIKNKVTQQIKQIKDGYHFSERLIILGDRGIGKTSTLFFVKDALDEHKIRVEFFSRLLQDANHFETITGDYLSEASRIPLYILIDFPDSSDIKKFKKFLDFLWSLLTHENYNKINLIFAMNKSHYEKSFSYSEIFGKFITLRLEKLDAEETEQLITSRLKLVKTKLNEVFNGEVLDLIFSYSKGIPRNIISACSLLVDNSNGKDITKSLAEKVLKEKYIEQVINDRVEDLELKKIYKQMTMVLESKFNGQTTSQEKYVKAVQEVCDIGRNSVLSRISELIKFGILVQYRGGYNRLNKIISFS